MQSSPEQLAVSGITVASSSSANIEVPFDGISPQAVIEALKAPDQGGIFATLPKYVGKSYPKLWEKLNVHQAAAVKEAFARLTPDQKDPVRQFAIGRVNPAAVSPDTTKNDKIRVLELRQDPSMQLAWNDALGGPRTRAAIDQAMITI